MKLKIGLLVFSEGKMRENVYKQRKPMQDAETKRFINLLRNEIDFIIPSCQEIRGKENIKAALEEFNTKEMLAVILYVPIFVSPALVAHAACQVKKPIVIIGNSTKESFSQLSFLAAGGAVDQIGIKNKRIPGDVSDPSVKKELLSYLKSILVSTQLEGTTFGCIGGRSLGISTGVSELVAWEKIFGVDIEHIDQMEVVYRAKEVKEESVKLYKDWIEASYGKIVYKKNRFDDNRLDKMIRSYLSVKSIIKDYELDFLGIKCQPELSNYFVLQCLVVQLLNDPYDAEGKKDPIPCSCEADNDGALTMQILNLLSEGQATALQDIFHVSDKELILANCGSSASFFSCLSKDPVENLKQVYLQPHGFGDAGGASTQFVFAEGTYTYARLFRKDGIYNMSFFKGHTVRKERKSLEEYSWYRPTAFVEIDIDSNQFLRNFGSNHIHCVCGDYTAELKEFCRNKKIEYTNY